MVAWSQVEQGWYRGELVVAYQYLQFDRFGGGLDLVSSINNVPDDYSPGAMNFRVSEYGGIEKVQGYTAFATLDDDTHDLFYYEQSDGSPKVIVSASPDKWQTITNAAVVTDIRTSMTTTTDTTFVSYADVLYGLDAANNMASWDGATLNTHAPGVNTGPPRGIILGIFDERMYVAPAANPMRVQYSEPGNFTSTGAWPTTNTVDLANPTTTDVIVGGAVTPEGLTIFARKSSHLLYDSTNGANRVIDAEQGCSSRRSITVFEGVVYGVNDQGVWRTTGSLPLEIVSRRVEPLFAESDSVFTSTVGARFRRSLLFCYDRTGSGGNDLTLDVSPQMNHSFMANEYAMACAVTSNFNSQEEFYFVDAADGSLLRKGFDGGSFAGSSIDCYYDIPPIALAGDSNLARLHRVRATGRGAGVEIGALADYYPAVRIRRPAEFVGAGGSGGVWGTGVWGTFVWGGDDVSSAWSRLPLRARRHSLRVYQAGTQTTSGRNVLGTPSDQLGGCAVYQLEFQFTPTSRVRQASG